MFRKTMNNLKNINSDYINNSYNIINHGNLTDSGTLQSPFTDLLRYDLDNLTILQSDNHISQQNLINNLNISSNNINTDLQNTKSLIGISTTNLQTENQLQQNQINSLIIQGVSGQEIDTIFGISGTIWDSKIGIIMGISLPIFGTTTNNLNNKVELYNSNIGISFNSLGSTQNLNNQEFQNFKSLTESNIITLNNLAITSDSRLDIIESDVYNLNITSALHELRLDNNDVDIININSDINDLQSFCYGTTASFSSTGVEWTETAIETIQDVVEYAGYIVDGVNISLWARDFYHQVQETSLWATINAHIANYNGYVLLQESTDAVQTTNIGLNSAGLIVATADILSLNVATALLSVSSNNIDEKLLF